jgi:hypothetical protein
MNFSELQLGSEPYIQILLFQEHFYKQQSSKNDIIRFEGHNEGQTRSGMCRKKQEKKNPKLSKLKFELSSYS